MVQRTTACGLVLRARRLPERRFVLRMYVHHQPIHCYNNDSKWYIDFFIIYRLNTDTSTVEQGNFVTFWLRCINYYSTSSISIKMYFILVQYIFTAETFCQINNTIRFSVLINEIWNIQSFSVDYESLEDLKDGGNVTLAEMEESCARVWWTLTVTTL